jgi:hypothetical protein
LAAVVCARKAAAAFGVGRTHVFVAAAATSGRFRFENRTTKGEVFVVPLISGVVLVFRETGSLTRLRKPITEIPRGGSR